MLVNSVIIVLREVLEAALMISVLLAVSRFLQLGSRWTVFALLFGLIGAATYGYFLDSVSELFEGVGQELVNAMLQFAVFAALAAVAFLIACQLEPPHEADDRLPVLMVIAVVLAVTREGSEILIFVSGFVQMNDFVSSVGVGSLAGAAIGFSIGVLFYYLLLALPVRRALLISLVLLSLIASGMCAQATKMLIQADWISVSGSLWDLSGVLPEGSLPGQLLYALIGYEASPSATEVVIYLSSLAVMALSVWGGWINCKNRSANSR
jgi:high-affinity iron transporter